MSLIKCENLSFIVNNENNEQVILNNLNFTIEKGDFVMVFGKSGSGKTTLFNIMVGLIKPTTGSVIIDNQNITEMNEEEKTYWRRFKIGYVFQNYGLFELLTVFDNIYLAKELENQFSIKAKKYSTKKEKSKPNFAEIDEVMRILKIDNLKNKFPFELSGGQQQRVSLARILYKKPEIIFADEPTGALDHETSKDVMDMMLNINAEGSTVVMITHNENLIKYANKVIRISDGNIIDSFENDNNYLKQTVLHDFKENKELTSLWTFRLKTTLGESDE